jgi:RNA polymerase sigma-70 factor (ECF subfamily)
MVPDEAQAECELERLYDAHAAALYGFALSVTRDESDTRDLLQDVFVKLARHPELLRGVRDERGFLLRLVHNAAIDAFRRRRSRGAHTEPLGEEPPRVFAPVDDPDEEAFRTAVAEAMAELPPEQRAVVHLKLWEGRTFDAIGALLEIPLNTAASRFRYGLDKLRSRLRPLYEELR